MADAVHFFRLDPVESSLIVHCQEAVAPHEIDMSGCKEEIAELVKEHGLTEVVFGLKEVKILSSRFLALMAAVEQLDVAVYVESPSPEVLDLLKLTRYDAVIKVRESAV